MRGGEPDASQNDSSSGFQRSPKAVKASSTNGSVNGSSQTNGHQHDVLAVQRSSDMSSNFYGHDREEVTRILIQGLQDLGYNQAANALTQESGFDLETNSAAAFRQAVLSGDWPTAEALLLGIELDVQSATNGNDSKSSRHVSSTAKLALTADADVQEMLFLLKQQKYLELLEQEDKAAALSVLRQELRPLHQDSSQLHALSSLIMCTSLDDLKAQAEWDGAQGESRKVLLSLLSRCISPAAMIPQHRLAELFHQVKAAQVQNCLFHNTPDIPSLYMDHQCDPDDVPTVPAAELTGHDDEVWVLRFSHDGTKLASAGADSQVILWDMETFEQIGPLVSRNHPRSSSTSHDGSVTNVCWSPDDAFIVTCSQDKEARIWDAKTRRMVHSIKYHSEHVTSAAFAPDGKTFVTGAFDIQRPLAIWELSSRSSTPLYAFPRADYRVRDCAVVAVSPPRISLDAHLNHDANAEGSSTSSDVRLIVVRIGCIDVFDYTRREKICSFDIQPEITCLNVSNDGQEILFNLNNNEIWALALGSGMIVRKYSGQKQGEFVIRGCYGGASEGFVVSGGEDSQISIWNRHTGLLLARFPSHGGPDSGCCINAVTWNSAKPWLWASAGDDKKVIIYSVAEVASYRRGIPTNGGMKGLEPDAWLGIGSRMMHRARS